MFLRQYERPSFTPIQKNIVYSKKTRNLFLLTPITLIEVARFKMGYKLDINESHHGNTANFN